MLRRGVPRSPEGPFNAIITQHELVLIALRTPAMLFMVIERFIDSAAVSKRFRERGRLIPESSGVTYIDSWMTPDGATCFQIMQAPSRASLDLWCGNWADLVRFEVQEIVPSSTFWGARAT